MTFAPTQRMIVVLTAVIAGLTTVHAQTISSACEAVCLGEGYCSASEVNFNCNIKCKGSSCSPSIYLNAGGRSATCSSHCEATPLGTAIIIVIIIAAICCCCVLPCFLFYKWGQSSRAPAPQHAPSAPGVWVPPPDTVAYPPADAPPTYKQPEVR
jgi:hypothetical protein